jgi:hypothetical protein
MQTRCSLFLPLFAWPAAGTVLYVLLGLVLTGMQPYSQIDLHAPFSVAFKAVSEQSVGEGCGSLALRCVDNRSARTLVMQSVTSSDSPTVHQ